MVKLLILLQSKILERLVCSLHWAAIKAFKINQSIRTEITSCATGYVFKWSLIGSLDPSDLFSFCCLSFSAFSWSTRSSDDCFSVYSHPDSQVSLLFQTPYKALFAFFSISVFLQSSNQEKEQNFPNMYFYFIAWCYFR